MMPSYQDVKDVAELCDRWPLLAADIALAGAVDVEHISISHPHEPSHNECPAFALHVARGTSTYGAQAIERERSRAVRPAGAQREGTREHRPRARRLESRMERLPGVL